MNVSIPQQNINIFFYLIDLQIVISFFLELFQELDS